MKKMIGVVLLTLGLGIIVYPGARPWMPVSVVTEAPRAEVQKEVSKAPLTAYVEVEGPKKLNIMEIIDKIVGWISTLAGTYFLFMNYAEKRGKKKVWKTR